MKVCLYLEGGKLLAQSGIGNAIRLQKKALEKAGVEYTLDPEDDWDIIHINTIGPKSMFMAKKAHMDGKKVITHAHTLDVDTANSFRGMNTVMPLFRMYIKYLYNQADHIVCPTEYAKGVLESWHVKPPVTAVSNGVDLGTYRFDEGKRRDYRRKYGLKGIVPFSVGHVFVRKGIGTFARVARDFDNQFMWFGKLYSKLLVGSKEVEDVLTNPPENVTFTGYVDDIVAAYCAGDIFFFPTLAETQGIVILEAWATERPVLIRDLPVFKGWTEDGKDCLKAKDDKDFSEKLGILMEDAALRRKLVKGGSRSVKEHSLDKIGAKLKGIYEGVLHED